MKPVRFPIRSFLGVNGELSNASMSVLRSDAGFAIETYSDLVARVAELSYANPEYLLLFRGQRRDYRDDDGTSLLPSMFRDPRDGTNYSQRLFMRYQVLRDIEQRLVQMSPRGGKKRFIRNQLLRWALVQHYELHPTPFLDVTQSLQIAASFALSSAEPGSDAFLYAIAMPQLSGTISVSYENSLISVRLGSVCPPDALRPFFQEGFLVGTFPLIDAVDQKQTYDRREVDFSRRLIGKFSLKQSSSFWGKLAPHGDETLYPSEESDLALKLADLRADLGRDSVRPESW